MLYNIVCIAEVIGGSVVELNAYQKAVIESARGDQKLSRTEKLSRLVIGLNEESGEVASITKKVLYHGRPLDLEHVKEELGDTLWYLAATADEFGLTLEDIAEYNLAKVKQRYPNGFQFERERQRQIELVRQDQ